MGRKQVATGSKGASLSGIGVVAMSGRGVASVSGRGADALPGRGVAAVSEGVWLL